jgi:hypothetical protein
VRRIERAPKTLARSLRIRNDLLREASRKDAREQERRQPHLSLLEHRLTKNTKKTQKSEKSIPMQNTTYCAEGHVVFVLL